MTEYFRLLRRTVVPCLLAAMVYAVASPSEPVKVEYAEGFSLEYHDSYRVLSVLNAYQDRNDTLRYVLVPRGGHIPAGIEYDQVIETPVRSMIATSTTHVGLLQMLDARHVLKGMAGANYVYDEKIRRRMDAGEIVTFRQGQFNQEEALVLDPDIIMISGGQASQFDDFRVLMQSGINVVVNSEWLETTPLGKAEWVKMMAALLNKEAMASRAFREVEKEYHQLKKKVAGVAAKPVAITGIPYKGAWFVPGGDSFTAQFLKDAGADYPWYGKSATGGLRMDFEVVYEAGLTADIWLDPGAAESKEDILVKDKRFTEFRSFQRGNIYNNNRRARPEGGNDFWESGVVHPERILADLIRIVHPDSLPGHQLYYYQKLQ